MKFENTLPLETVILATVNVKIQFLEHVQFRQIQIIKSKW